MFVLFVKLRVIFTLMDVGWLSECVLIVLPQNSLFSFSVSLDPLNLWSTRPERRNSADMPCLFKESLSSSPLGVECFLRSLCQIWSPHSTVSLSFPPCECQCGWAAASWIPHVQIPCMAFIRTWTALLASPSTTTAAPSSSNHCFPIAWNLFFSLAHEAWNTSFYIGIGRYLNFWCDPGYTH